MTTRGSSPLARGLPYRTGTRTPHSRIIPARAGFTRAAGAGPDTRSDHPRSRGVYPALADTSVAMRGSSPLARGLPVHDLQSQRDLGIIPARAGFTRGPGRWRHRAQDHPRSRGVYPRRRPVGRLRRGSSPLARGLLTQLSQQNASARIIPARAGFTGCEIWAVKMKEDHPRSRGVYKSVGWFMAFAVGSSPLARGLPSGSSSCETAGRIIPARAGFTCDHPADRNRGRDHPRSRGVYVWRTRFPNASEGSSPLARGLLRHLRHRHRQFRIIPARAGFTLCRIQSVRSRRDHPRSRGVYLSLHTSR